MSSLSETDDERRQRLLRESAAAGPKRKPQPPAGTPDAVGAFAAYLAGLDDPDARAQALSQARMAAVQSASPESLEAGSGRDDEGYRLDLIAFDTVTAKRTDWLWQGRIPRGMLSEVIGTEGLGKTALHLELVARVTRGKLEGDFKGKPADVVLLTTEDDPSRTILPRLRAARADVGRVKFLRLTKDGKDGTLVLPRDAGRLGRAIGEAGARLLVIDPLAGVLDPSVDTYKDTDVRGALTPLLVAAQEHDFAVLGVRHTNKGKSTDARERAIGSVGFRQVVRSALVVTVDPDDPEGKAGSGRIVAHDKCNVGKLARSVRFELGSVDVDIDGKPEPIVRAELGAECDWRASDGLAAETGMPRERMSPKATAAEALLHELCGPGPCAVSVLKTRASAEAIGWRSMEAAKAALGLDSWKPKGSNANVWGWPIEI